MAPVGEDIDGSYSIMGQQGIIPNIEYSMDDKLNVRFHEVSEYDMVATEGEFIEPDDANGVPIGKAVKKFGTIKHPMRKHPMQTVPYSAKKDELPVFNKKLYVRIVIPGERGDVIDREAMEMDKQRYRKQYEAFLGGKDQHAAAGIPIEVLLKVGDPPILAINEVDTLKYQNVCTCEQLVAVPDSSSPIPGFKDTRRKVALFLKASKDNKLQNELEAKNAELEARLARLEANAGAKDTSEPARARPPQRRRSRSKKAEQEPATPEAT